MNAQGDLTKPTGGLAITAALMWLLVLPSATSAQEWILGAGFADFSRQGAVDGAILSLEYHHTPFYTRGRLDIGWAGAAVVHDTGDAFLGVGLTGRYALDANWFIDATVLPGVFVENEALNNLGSAFEIRSLLGIGYRFDNGAALSLALTHKSNASTAPINPGVNSILLRWHFAF